MRPSRPCPLLLRSLCACCLCLLPAPHHRVSSGIQVDELRFGADGKVSEAWVKRQMTAEERSALVARPVGEQPAFDDVKVVQVGAAVPCLVA